MEIRSLRTFLAVLETGSFRAAAERLGVTQPAISQTIANLEDELSCRLFDRRRRGITPTFEGERLAEMARPVVGEFDELPTRFDRVRGEVRGRLEIGTTDVASIYVLPKVYRAFRSRYPQVDLSVRVEGTAPLLDQLHRAAIELAIITLSAGDRDADVPPPFRAEPLFREQLDFLVARQHPFAKRRRVTLEDLASEPLITFKPDSITRQAVDSVFREAGLEPRIGMEMSSPEAIKKLVGVGLGLGVLPYRSVAAEVRAGSLRTLRVEGVDLQRVLGIVRDAGRSPSPAAAAFLDLLERIRNVEVSP